MHKVELDAEAGGTVVLPRQASMELVGRQQNLPLRSDMSLHGVRVSAYEQR